METSTRIQNYGCLNMGVNKTVVEGDFGIIPNKIWSDPRLKHADVRVYGYIRSKPPGWNVNNSDVCRSLGMHRSTLAASWKRLEASAWMSREKLRDRSGTFNGGFIYTLHAAPLPLPNIGNDLMPVLPTCGENRPLSNKELNTKKENPSSAKKRKRNLWFDAVAKCHGYGDTVPKTMASAVGQVARDLKTMGATPEEIPLRFAEGQRRFDNFSPMGLVKWWPKLASSETTEVNYDMPAGL